MDQSTTAPSVPEHQHKYFLFETKATFEPIPLELKAEEFIDNSEVMGNATTTYPPNALYGRVEYAIMACNCGDVTKSKVKDGDQK